MNKLHFSIDINAPKEKVWNTMLGEETYSDWTDAFMPGSNSSYVGDWNEGSKILFVAQNENGEMEGMVSRIKENRPYEFVSIEHLGILKDGKEITSGPEVEGWGDALENYTFKETNGVTQVLVDTDTEEEYEEMFQDMWPKALQKLKELAEK
jgi:hypothetical protein